MKPALLEHLVCPSCAAPLVCEAESVDGAEVLEGILRCSACSSLFPIRRGVPRMVPAALAPSERATARAFGEQWKILSGLSGVFRAEFQSYLDPLSVSELTGLTVLDAGCGSGKFAFAAVEAGAKTVIAVDLSDAVDVAYANLRGLPGAHVVQASIYQLPLRPGHVDFAYSIGVLHHLPDPHKGFQQIVPLLRPGGRILMWLYALEGNEAFVRWLDPLRSRVLSRLPSWVNRVIATALAAPLWCVIRLGYLPLARWGHASRLPYAPYFLYFSRLGFSTFWGTVYDKLVPPISFYLTREEISGWILEEGLTMIHLRHRNRNSWSCLALKGPPA